VHAIILEKGRGSVICFDDMQNGAIWGHFRVSNNIESSTILMTLIEKNFLKLSKIFLRVLVDTNTSIAVYKSTSKSH
jgi:hypothetical protein